MKSFLCVLVGVALVLTCLTAPAHAQSNDAATADDADDFEYEDDPEVEAAETTTTTTKTSNLDGQSADEGNMQPKLRTVYELDSYCSGEMKTCSGLSFPDRGEVAFFELKQLVHIDGSSATYELDQERTDSRYRSLVFQDSAFSNFPLHLFYSLGIEELDMRNCSVEAVSWEAFLSADKLSILLLGENRITEIGPRTFDKAEGLQFLFLDANRIGKLYSDSFAGLEKLSYLSLANNQLEELPVGLFDSLEMLKDLNLQNNRLRLIDGSTFLGCPQLFVLILSGNRLSQVHEYALRNKPQMAMLDLSDNQPLESLVLNVRCERVLADNCSLSRVNIYGPVVHVTLDNNHIQELYFSEPEALQTLSLRSNNLQQIASLNQVTNLEVLDVSNNPNLLVLPDPWNLNSLERLDLSRTNLKYVPISSLAEHSRLRSLNISHNSIKEMNPKNFKYLQKLTHFYIHGNNWNCFNLRAVMDLLIRPYHISYTHDVYDPQFPGEYINGIACMYRMDSNEDDEEEVRPRATATRDLKVQEGADMLRMPEAEESEVESLRREFKVIVNFYDEKFEAMSQRLADLSERLSKFEALNGDFWKQITITT